MAGAARAVAHRAISLNNYRRLSTCRQKHPSLISGTVLFLLCHAIVKDKKFNSRVYLRAGQSLRTVTRGVPLA